MGWRNLWRNGRRTWLTAGGVAFAVFLVVAFMCVQLGSYATMEQTATSLLTGEIQVQHRRYLDDPRLEHAIDDADHLAARVAAEPGVAAVAARAEAYALASVGERSFGAQVIGIDPGAEAGVVTLAKQIFEGGCSRPRRRACSEQRWRRISGSASAMRWWCWAAAGRVASPPWR
ncbi:MAG: ABC transporter permease [bacterium]